MCNYENSIHSLVKYNNKTIQVFQIYCTFWRYTMKTTNTTISTTMKTNKLPINSNCDVYIALQNLQIKTMQGATITDLCNNQLQAINTFTSQLTTYDGAIAIDSPEFIQVKKIELSIKSLKAIINASLKKINIDFVAKQTKAYQKAYNIPETLFTVYSIYQVELHQGDAFDSQKWCIRCIGREPNGKEIQQILGETFSPKIYKGVVNDLLASTIVWGVVNSGLQLSATEKTTLKKNLGERFSVKNTTQSLKALKGNINRTKELLYPEYSKEYGNKARFELLYRAITEVNLKNGTTSITNATIKNARNLIPRFLHWHLCNIKPHIAISKTKKVVKSTKSKYYIINTNLD